MSGKVKGVRTKAGTSRAEAEKRRALFVQALIGNGGNVTQAAIKAGFSEKTAHQQGSRLLKDVKVAAALKTARAAVISEAECETGISIRSVLVELGRILQGDLRDCFDRTSGVLLPPHQWPEHAARAVASVKVVEKGGGQASDVPMFTKEVRLWDKNSAIDKAMRHLGLFEVDNQQRPAQAVNVGRLTVELDFDAARRRARQYSK